MIAEEINRHRESFGGRNGRLRENNVHRGECKGAHKRSPRPRLPVNCGQFAIIYDLPTRHSPAVLSRETCECVCERCLNVKVNAARFSPRPVSPLSPFYVPSDRVNAVLRAQLPTWCNRGKKLARVSRYSPSGIHIRVRNTYFHWRAGSIFH